MSECKNSLPLRIAFFVTYFPKMSEVFLLNQALELLDRGHEVTIHALAEPREARQQSGTERLLPHQVRTGRMASEAWSRPLDLPRLFARNHLREVLHAMNIWRYGAEAGSLRNLYRLEAVGQEPIECDVAHAQFGHVGRQCVLLSAMGRLRAPLITSFRGYDLSGYLRFARSGLYESVFQRSSSCLTVSTRFMERLKSLGCPEHKIHVLPSGIPMSRVPRRDWSGPAEPLRVFSASRLERYKGLHLGLEAFCRIASDFPGAKYEVFGDGPERSRLEALSHRLGLEGRVIWHGMVSQAQVFEALVRCRLHLFTTVASSRGRTEGMPNILKESQAVGLPAVAFCHPGVDEVVEEGQTGFLVKEGDVEAMAERARQILADRGLAASMGDRGRVRSRVLFDISTLTDRLESIYQAAMEIQR